ncbi:rhomboid family intramembrane serine protease [Cereibacter changlensis]|uniref:rhomboid family intramembrane serine protease n=1 Tax=Cereibacter changlensis TaxID=402884 RepID=UPI0040341010
MFPIRDHNPSGRTPYVTYALIAANVVIFLGYWLVLPSEETLNWFFFRFGLVPAAVTSGQGWAGFLTSMFLHGGWMHLFGNMLFLYIFGDNLEDLMGHVGFLVFYLAAGLAAAAGQVLADPWSPLPMVGASGAIAGVMGGYLLLFPRAKVDVLIIFVIFFRIFPIPAWIMLGLWFGLQLISGLSAPSDMGGVAYWAHSGGFLAGLVFTLPFWLRKGGPAFWSVTHGQPPHPHPDYALQRSRIPTVRRKR